MCDKPFRVLLDVTELNTEFVNYVWVNVSPRELKTIADFKSDVLKKLHIDKNIRFFLRGGLLLEEETIIILREDDTIKVKYEGDLLPVLSTSVDESTQNALKKRNFDDCSENQSIICKKKCKRKDSNISETDEQERIYEVKNDKKKKRSHSLPFIDNIVPSRTDNEMTDMELTCTKVAKTRVKDSPKILNEENIETSISFSENLNTTAESSVGNVTSLKSESEVLQGNNCRKKKRKRHKKRKDFNFETSSDNNESVLSFTVQPVTANLSSSCIRKHVVFTSPDPYHNTSDNESTEIKMLDSHVIKCQNSNADEHCDKVFVDNSQKATVSLSNGVLHKKSLLKLSVAPQENSTSININYNDFSAVEQGSSLDCRLDASSKAVKYSDCPVLYSLPEVGSKIVYKLLELNEHYCPEVSDYKEGIIKIIDPETDEIEIELLRHEIKPGRTGKFENLRDDEVPLPEIVKTEKVTWSTLIEPRLILS